MSELVQIWDSVNINASFQGKKRPNSLFAFLMSLVRKRGTALNTRKTDTEFLVGGMFFPSFTCIMSGSLAGIRGNVDETFQLLKAFVFINSLLLPPKHLCSPEPRLSVLPLSTARRAGLGVFSRRIPEISPVSSLDKRGAEASVARMALCLQGRHVRARRGKGKALLAAPTRAGGHSQASWEQLPQSSADPLLTARR